MRDVGIVMPVYKQVPEYLNIALQSILRQTYQNYHFVIVSDGAPPETNELIRRITSSDPRVTFIVKQKNEGVARTLNIGFEHLMKIQEVKYLTWVSSDNLYYPGFIEKLRRALENAAVNVGLAYSSFRHIDSNGDFLKEPGLEEFYKYQDQPKNNLMDVCFIGTSFMYKKEVAAKIEGYRLEPVEDYDYWLRLTEHCEIVYVREVLMEYRTNSPLSISNQLNNSKTKQRSWRYAFNLARQEARNRRGIPFMLTVIYPLSYVDDQIIEKLEKLLDQSYSNFKLLICDLSLDKSVTRVLSQISDPRVAFLSMSGENETRAIYNGIQIAGTLFTLIYGDGSFPKTNYSLYSLINHGQIEKEKMRDMFLEEFGVGKFKFHLIEMKGQVKKGCLYLTHSLIKHNN